MDLGSSNDPFALTSLPPLAAAEEVRLMQEKFTEENWQASVLAALTRKTILWLC